MTNPANIIVDEICEICDKYFATEFGYSAETNAALSQIREALDLDLDVEVRLLQGIELFLGVADGIFQIFLLLGEELRVSRIEL